MVDKVKFLVISNKGERKRRLQESLIPQTKLHTLGLYMDQTGQTGFFPKGGFFFVCLFVWFGFFFFWLYFILPEEVVQGRIPGN